MQGNRNEAWAKWDSKDFEHQMQCRRWNPNKTPDQAYTQYFANCTSETEKARKQIQYEANIAYGKESTRQKYDVYGTDLDENSPIFFWIHGGYWQGGSKDIFAQMALNMYEIGVKTIVFGYTLAPEVSISEIKTEVHSGLAHAMERYKHAKFFVVGGHSAGGHLTASLLHENNVDESLKCGLKSRVLGLLIFSGVLDLRPLVLTTINNPLKLTWDTAEKLSPVQLSFNPEHTSENLKIQILVGEYDSPEFQRQSQAYLMKLKKEFPQLKDVSLWTSPKDDHYTIVERLCDPSSGPGSVARKFVEDILKSSIEA